MPPQSKLLHRLDTRLRALADAPAWYLAYSGGLDSTVLLHLLHAWCAGNGGPPLRALHVHHGMQAAADSWAAHCERNCVDLGVPLATHTVAVTGGEAGAREARYAVFEASLAAGEVLFLAHHLDDQVETFFLRLMRGAGVAGLAGMPAARALGAGTLLRPLLDTPRSDLHAYAMHHHLDYVEDPSNADTGLDRNFLRARVLPLLGSRWPGYRRAVARAGAHMAAADGMLRETLGVPESVYSVCGDPGCPIEGLTADHCEAFALRLRYWLQAHACKPPDRASLEEFLRQLSVAVPAASPRLDAGSYVLQRYRDAVYLLPPFVADPPQGQHPIAPGQTERIAGVGEVGLIPAAAGVALGAGDEPYLAWREGGEHCRPVGHSGTIALKALLQERQVPPWWRARLPLVYLEGELLAVGDLVVCASSRYRSQPEAGERLWRLHWERFRGPFD
mgnify:CR=1 FL=1